MFTTQLPFFTSCSDRKTLQQKMDLGGMPELLKGFGNVGKALEGKLGKHVEGRAMPFVITDHEIDEVVVKFETTRTKYPEIIKKVTHKEMKVVADYLGENKEGKPDRETWDMVARGNVYSHACFLHEYTEREYRTGDNPKWYYHGGGLFEEYQFLQDFIKLKTGVKYDIIKLCYNDNLWDSGEKDKANPRLLRKYMKEKREGLFDPKIHVETEWNKGSNTITRIMDALKSEGDL